MKPTFGEGKLDSYQKLGDLGKGAYGVVYKALNRKTEQTVAIKKIHY